MAEVGAALREARTRARIEIAQMEAQTKIRAKYLRALENEEWELLPGPTYVKSFLKTYGDMLGLDGRQLVADYKRGNEPFQAEGDIGQLSKHTGGRINRRQQHESSMLRIGLSAIVALVIVAGAAYALTTRGKKDTPTASTPIAQVPAGDGGDAGSAAATGDPAEVVVTATKKVTVCVRAGKRLIVRQQSLAKGEKTKVARGRTVVVTAFERDIRLTVDGQRRTLPPGAGGPITVEVTSTGVSAAPATVSACRV